MVFFLLYLYNPKKRHQVEDYSTALIATAIQKIESISHLFILLYNAFHPLLSELQHELCNRIWLARVPAFHEKKQCC